jgi:hypothetical protein
VNISAFRPRLLGTSVLLAAALAVSVSGPVLAVNTVTQVLSGGALTASIANLTMSPISVTHVPQISTGTLTLSADDSTGTGLGWNVTVVASDFVYAGVYAQDPIDAASFSVAAASQPTLIAGQPVSLTAANGPQVPPTTPNGLTLDTARKVLQATAAYGAGSYTQALGVALEVPADRLPGTYTATLTTTILTGSV